MKIILILIFVYIIKKRNDQNMNFSVKRYCLLFITTKISLADNTDNNKPSNKTILIFVIYFVIANIYIPLLDILNKAEYLKNQDGNRRVTSISQRVSVPNPERLIKLFHFEESTVNRWTKIILQRVRGQRA